MEGASKKACPSYSVPALYSQPGTMILGDSVMVSISPSSTVTMAPCLDLSPLPQNPVYRYTLSPSVSTPGSNWGSSPARSPSRVPSE